MAAGEGDHVASEVEIKLGSDGGKADLGRTGDVTGSQGRDVLGEGGDPVINIGCPAGPARAGGICPGAQEQDLGSSLCVETWNYVSGNALSSFPWL